MTQLLHIARRREFRAMAEEERFTDVVTRVLDPTYNVCVCVFFPEPESRHWFVPFFVKRKKKQSIIKHGGVYEMMCLYTEYIFWFYPILPYKFIPFFLLKPHDPSHWHKYIKIVNPLSFWSFSWNLFLSIVIFIRNTYIALIEYITSNIIINYEMSVLNFKIYVIINYKCINISNICNFFQKQFCFNKL